MQMTSNNECCTKSQVIHSYPQQIAFLISAEPQDIWDLSPLRDTLSINRAAR
jgi:hypothetical protein